ncbi:PilZ domain-containing protein [Sphingobium rhizovicinum]|uniref:PilZ domain-containing protein n=1 Tax=Sphingobium rhizovicinum TaxID=432308 RepID=A0ABV7N9L0_9SPHN
MQIKRSRERIVVDIPIVVTTVLDSLEGTIVDLSEGGAQVVGCTLPPRSQCQLDLDGHVVFGTVRWSEEDRMGIRFPYELVDGPLFDKLELARGGRRSPVPFQPRFTAPAMGGGFGRRAV